MKKIKTIFERNWEGDGKIINQPIKYENYSDLSFLKFMKATEKLDGTNVRVTVRNHMVMRVEKRRNPDKIQKAKGVVDPWYVDASEFEAQDKWIFDGIKNTDFSEVPDGEWSGELIGPNIQGNPLNLPTNRIVFFTLGQAPVFDFGDVPFTYEGLKAWLPAQKSKYGTDCGIEGIVWHDEVTGSMFKIKTKDFQ